MPKVRTVAGKYGDLTIEQVKRLLHSGIHEHRLTALLILVDKFAKADATRREKSSSSI